MWTQITLRQYTELMAQKMTPGKKLCSSCEAPLEGSHQFCRNCGQAVAAQDLETEHLVVMKLPPRTSPVQKKFWTKQRIIEYIIVGFIILFLLAIAIPSYSY